MAETYFQFFSIVFLVAVALTYIYKIIAIRFNFIAVPNNRSSHNKLIPTGGGIVIGIVYIWSFIYLLFYIEQVSAEVFQVSVGLAMGGIAITIVGFIDDIFETRELTKLIIQIMLSIWNIYVFLLNIDNFVDLISNIYYWPFIFLALFILVWLINVFNFMDAIDGMALSGSIMIAWSAAFIIMLTQGNNENSIMLFLLGIICFAFLVFNFPPASIFMGDAGSLFLGYFFGGIIVKTFLDSDINFWTWVILLAHFLTETTLSTLMRIKLTKAWYKAHRSLSYQNLARILNSHKKVTIGSILFYIIWLFPLAILSCFYINLGPLLFLIAIIPVIIMVIKYGPLFSIK